MDGDIWFIGVVGAVTITLIVALLIVSGREAREWDEFASAHHCRIVGKMDSSMAPGLSSSGKFVATFVPGKIGYACDDGITYWRDS